MTLPRHLVVSLAPALLAGLLLAALYGFEVGTEEPFRRDLSLVVLAGVALGSLHRPFAGATLSSGALALPVVLALFSPVAAGALAAVGLGLGELGRRLLWNLSPSTPEERRGFVRVAESAGRAALATLAAAFTGRILGWLPGVLPWPAVAGAGAVYLAVFAGLLLADQRLRRPGEPLRAWRTVQPLVVDALGWGLGAAVVAAGLAAGWPLASVLLVGFGLFALEAARSSFLQGAFAHRAVELEQVTLASDRMPATGFELVDLAGRIRSECLRVLPFHWYQLESGGLSFWAGPSGRIQEGEPDPDPVPPPMPGLHRRANWLLVERELQAEGQVLGRLRLWCDPRRLAPGDVGLLDNLRPQLAAWLHRAVLDREAREDGLTGLVVRRVLERALAEAFARSYDGGGALAAILVDVDHFKRINDTHGHSTGDRVLAGVARALRREAREGEVVARYGGEEFVVMVPGAEGAVALDRAERLRRAIEALDIGSGGEASQPIPITASLGIASFPELYVPGPAELLALADEALYEAKRRGRNRSLLALGLGRYRSTLGETLTAEATPRVMAETPRFFA
ncbi:MAG: GGDEF domain-containing protein [Thermoanaerobaculia bacterium]|nr:GGDEF domain-containing protein [Thermoanaerobaculia bacterium]